MIVTWKVKQCSTECNQELAPRIHAVHTTKHICTTGLSAFLPGYSAATIFFFLDWWFESQLKLYGPKCGNDSENDSPPGIIRYDPLTNRKLILVWFPSDHHFKVQLLWGDCSVNNSTIPLTNGQCWKSCWNFVILDDHWWLLIIQEWMWTDMV